MSKITDELSLDLSAAEAELACKQAVAALGWGIQSAEPGRIVPRIGVGISRNPSKIEVLIESDVQTTICLNGRIVGIGPLQKRHVTAEVNKLRNAIEVAGQELRRDASG